jgi:class 3 adenylate cyclase
MICPQCTQIYPQDKRYCSSCGCLLVESEEECASGRFSTNRLSIHGNSLEPSGIRWSPHLPSLTTSQNRYVAVLFTDLSGYTEAARQLENEVLYELMQQYINLLAEEIYKYEGVVDKLTGDGIMALFGAPVAHENNIERALRAALEMQARVEDWSKKIIELFNVHLRMRVGVHAGPVIIGGISNILTEYTAIGETVNFAQRIEAAAPAGEIFVSQAVYNQTKYLFDYIAVDNVTLKGFNQPIVCFRLNGVVSHQDTPRMIAGLNAPLTGRQVELNALQKALNKLVEQKTGQFILITGDAGIGKSRLVQEFKKTIEVEVKVIEGRSLTYRRSVPYWIFNELIKNYLDIPAGLHGAELGKKIRNASQEILGSDARQFLPYLYKFFPVQGEDYEISRDIQGLDTSSLRQKTFHTISELLLWETRQRPVVFILEDLHWIDDASLELLRYLLERISEKPFLLLGITRTSMNDSLGKFIDWAKDELNQHFQNIEISKLDMEHSQELLVNLLQGGEIQEALCQQLIEKAGGVPLYLEEILHTLINARLIERRGRQWVSLESIDAVNSEVPISLQGIILSRYDQLPEDLKHILQVASVIGQHFTIGLLAYALGEMNQKELTGILDVLVNDGFVIPSFQNQPTEYTFKHVLFSEAIYNTMLKKDRSYLHGIVGQAIENIYTDQSMDHIELLARHYSWSANFTKALHYLILAAQKAAANFVYEQARKHFEHALALLPIVDHSVDQALQVHLGLGDVYSAMGEYQSSKRHFEVGLNKINGEDKSRYAAQRRATLEKIEIITSLFESTSGGKNNPAMIEDI